MVIDSPDAIVVEVVEDGQAVLVSLPVVRLCSPSTEKNGILEKNILETKTGQGIFKGE